MSLQFRRGDGLARVALALEEAPLQRLVSWVCDEALPRWAPAGEGELLPFAERLGLDGSRQDARFVRLQVMARQVAVYAQAAMSGLARFHPAAERGWQALVEHCWTAGSGWVAKINRYGDPVDGEYALNDQALAIYACACWARASGSPEAIALGRRTLTLIDRRLRVPGQPGWRSVEGVAGRDQKGHMRLLGALLALHAVAPSHESGDRIAEILRLAHRQLYDPATGAIPEWFDDQWRPLAGRIEFAPGHQFEWCWLLSRARDQGFEVALPAERLFAFAQLRGWNDATGLLHERLGGDGAPLSASHRLGPHCQAIRMLSTLAGSRQDAVLARLAGGRLPEAFANAVAARICDTFLTAPFSGGWIDGVDPDLNPLVDHVPACSLHHLWEAASAVTGAGWTNLLGSPPC